MDVAYLRLAPSCQLPISLEDATERALTYPTSLESILVIPRVTFLKALL